MWIIERRKRKPLTQTKFELYLNTNQMNTYIYLREIGWRMYFIRRSLLRNNTVVMKSSAGTSIAVIERDGRFTINPNKMTTRRAMRERLTVIDSERIESTVGV